MFFKGSLYRKLLFFALCLAVIPVAVNLLFSYRATQSISAVASEKTTALAYSDMDHILTAMVEID